MAKQSLESQVREALVQKRTDELVKYASESPNYRTMVTEIVEALGDSMIELIVSSLGDIDEEKEKEMITDYRAEVLPQIRAQMDNPQQTRQIMEEQARNQYLSYRQLKTKIGSAVGQLRTINEDADKDEAIDETALKGFEKSFEGMFQYARTNDKIVRRLTRIAEQEGLDVATQKETGYRVIRELFPTPNDYRAYASRGLENMRKFFQQAQSSLTADGMTGQLVGSMMGAMGKVMEKALEIGKRVEGDYLEKTIKEIYA